MKILIVEDELFSAKKLIGLLSILRKDYTIVGQPQSIKELKEVLSTEKNIDLIFMDIHLSDGNSFSIFEEVDIDVPIIFTTAYDEYALKAFKVNSIDYLLKPIDSDDLEKALLKFEKTHNTAPLEPSTALITKNRTRFLIKKGSKFNVVTTSSIAYIFSDNKVTQLITHDNHRYVLDISLEQLKSELAPSHFFRINRKMIVAIDAISEIHSHFNGRLKLMISPPTQEDIFVSRERVSDFKKWLDS